MNLYTCTRCTLSEDQDIVKDPDRKIGLVLHLILPYDGTYAKERIYLCMDCMQEVRKEVLKMREYYEHMARDSHREAYQTTDHDHREGPDDGCPCAEDDGYRKDV